MYSQSLGNRWVEDRLEIRFDRASQMVAALCRQLTRQGDIHPLIDRIAEALSELPLTTGEYCLGCVRLRNIRRYGECLERNAAAYESQMLSSLIARCRDAYMPVNPADDNHRAIRSHRTGLVP